MKAREFTKNIYREPYPSIDPYRDELSQRGKTILVTGGSNGIGFATARAFIRASAARVIITGRRASALSDAVARLDQIKPIGSSTIIESEICDYSDSTETGTLWYNLQKRGIEVNVLVLNASGFSHAGKILEQDTSQVWKDYEVNVKSVLHWATEFNKQGSEQKKYLVQTSSVNIHDFHGFASDRSSYGITRNGGTLLLQQLARDNPPSNMQIISFHPGYVLTEAARAEGLTEDSFEWDSEDVAGQFAVWAASDEAEFLHGRCVWSNWDVEELSSDPMREQITNDDFFLRIGVNGW